MSSLKEKTEYQRGKVLAIEGDIGRLGFIYDVNATVNNISVQAIKQVLIEKGLTTTEDFELIYLQHAEIIMKKLLDECREQRKQTLKKKLIIPGKAPVKVVN